MDSIKENNINKTLELLDKSYCPYSKFRVASSVITKDNQFFPGVNVENASYGLTMCAERNAIFNAITNGIKKEDISYLIVVSDCTNNLIPCGACLQVLTEFINENTKILICSNNNIKEYKLSDFLPYIFKKV